MTYIPSSDKQPCQPLKNVVVPENVKEAWETVAQFLNTLPNLSFSISPWYETGKFIGERKYTLHSGGEDHRELQIIAKSEWIGSDKTQ